MRTVWYEPAIYSWKHDRRRSIEAYGQLAEEVWFEASRTCPELLSTPDYGAGFRDGFVDYVYAGGNGEPPPVPPRHFWNVMLRTPEGKQRADQWFAGYRHGAAVARDGGYRALGVVDSSLYGLKQWGPNGGLRIEPRPPAADPDLPGEEPLPEPSPTPAISSSALAKYNLSPVQRSNESNNDLPSPGNHEADAFRDDPVEQRTMPRRKTSTISEPVFVGTVETPEIEIDLPPSIGTEPSDVSTSVVLPPDEQPVHEIAAQIVGNEQDLARQSIAKVSSGQIDSGVHEAPMGDIERAHSSTMTMNRLRGLASPPLTTAPDDDNPTSAHAWSTPVRTQIRIKQNDKPSPSRGFIPYGVTFDR